MRIIGLVLAALALAGASAAYGGGPDARMDHDRRHVHLGRLRLHRRGDRRRDPALISWFDDAGKRTRQIVLAPDFHVTWRNAETGESVSSASPYVVHKEDNPDGSPTIAFTGLVSAVTGGGPARTSPRAAG